MASEAIVGKDFFVDKKYEVFISKFKWKRDSRPKNRAYFYTQLNGKKVYLHRLIFGLFADFDIDHSDRKASNNCLENLRSCNRSENTANSVRQRKVSPYRGVCKKYRKWSVTVQEGRKRHRKYGFSTPEDAARAYDRIAARLWGKFAILNFPEEWAK